MTLFKKFVLVFVAVVVIASAFGGGVFFGYSNGPKIEKVKSLYNKEPIQTTTIDFEPFWSAWSTIESKYVSDNGVNHQKMVWGAIAGLAKSLDDPYTVFFPPKEAEEFKEEMSGNFQGVGMEIAIKDDILTVVAPLEGTPAERAGIRAGDKVLKVDDKSTMDMSIEEAVKNIRGERGTVVILTVLHKGEKNTINISVTRDVIQIPVIKTEEKGDSIFVIKLHSFSGNSSNLFREALNKFINSGNSKLILDLRSNPGGYLESAVDIASWFLPSGEVVVREKFGDGKEDLFRSKGYDAFRDVNLPFIILVNEGSASASEIVAGALKEHGIAKLVGQTTFGKGSVQELVEISEGSSLKITTARWLTPEGNFISEIGIEPDEVVEITPEDLENDLDPQMDKAIEVLKNW